jgi:hypothetical protein
MAAKVGIMKKAAWCSATAFAVAMLVAVFGSGPAFAQSTGNFSASGTSVACAIGAGGSFAGSPGVCDVTAGSTTQCGILDVDISTSNGNGVTLLVRPSLVTGLFTDTKISTTIPLASADVGIQVCVTVDGSGTGVKPASCVIYDQRFQQISTNLFNIITECATADPACNFDLILSTLGARSFDFVVPVGIGKPHHVEVTWSTFGTVSNNAASSIAACVGPGTVTVEGVKVFNNSGSLTFN